MLSVFLDDPFLISPSVFSNVYMMLLVFVINIRENFETLEKTEETIKNGLSKDTGNMVTQDTGRLPATSYKH
jgi:hypothetical protein